MGFLAAARQATSSNQSVLGTNLSLGCALAMAIAITTVMLAIPLYALGWFDSHSVGGASIFTYVFSNPFRGVTASGVAAALWITVQFFPLSFMVSCTLARISFMASLNAVMWSTVTIVRFLVG
jgi:hypothetical protein